MFQLELIIPKNIIDDQISEIVLTGTFSNDYQNIVWIINHVLLVFFIKLAALLFHEV